MATPEELFGKVVATAESLDSGPLHDLLHQIIPFLKMLQMLPILHHPPAAPSRVGRP